MSAITKEDALTFLKRYQLWRTGTDARTMTDAKILPAEITANLNALMAHFEADQAELATLREERIRINGLRKLMGYTQDGSSQPVSLFQDDATNAFFVSVGQDGRRFWHESSFRGAIDKAMEANSE